MEETTKTLLTSLTEEDLQEVAFLLSQTTPDEIGSTYKKLNLDDKEKTEAITRATLVRSKIGLVEKLEAQRSRTLKHQTGDDCRLNTFFGIYVIPSTAL